MTLEELNLFKIFIDDDVYNNDIVYRFIMKSGDTFLVCYDGEGESNINPQTGEECDYYGFVFLIILVEIDKTGNYCNNSFVEISKYDYPVSIDKIENFHN